MNEKQTENEDHYLSRCALDSHMEDMLLVLEEEIVERGVKPSSVEYSCPHCSFKSEFFNIVTIHIAVSMDCSKSAEKNPCYPIQKLNLRILEGK